MRRVVTIALIFLGVLGLALLGQYRSDPASFFDDPVQHVYQGIQLFVLEGDWTRDMAVRPIEIDVARFLAPLIALASLVLVFARGAWVALANARARFAKDHIVLVGLNPLGWHFARSCRGLGLRTVAIERKEDNVYVDRCRRLGVPVIIGDALLADTLLRAGVGRASDLVTFVRDDGTNVELTLRVKTFSRDWEGRRSAPLRVRCHLANTQLADRLEQYPKFFLDPHLAEISFFNAHGLAARTLLQRRPPEVFADALRATEVHVVILGGTPLGEQVMLHVARMAHYANFSPPRLTMCLEGAVAFGERMARVHPGLGVAARVDYVEMPVSPDLFARDDEPFPITDATMYVVCIADDSVGLSLALALRRATLLGRGRNAPVMVAMERSDGLAWLLESERGRPEIPDGLYPFGMLDDIVSAENIVDERIDRLAQAFHDNYLEATAASKTDSIRPSQVPWRKLPEVYRRASRLEADHLDVKLRAVGCREEDTGASFEFTPEELARLARMEHDRFVAVRYSTGWRGGDVRSDFARIDDQLAPWSALDEAGRRYDIDTVRSIPANLSMRLGRHVRREIVIGVTGHRLHRLRPDLGLIEAAIERTLDGIVRLYPDAVFAVMSSLAEGADRLVARIAMKRLAARLYVPLPLPYDLYAEDFGSAARLDRTASINEFHELLGQADRYFELPLSFGSVVELSRRDEVGSRARSRQYALAGAYVVQRCHELVALWDGRAHEGEGGTAQVVAWRCQGVPAEYRFPDGFFPSVDSKAPFVIPVDAGAEFVPARYTG